MTVMPSFIDLSLSQAPLHGRADVAYRDQIDHFFPDCTLHDEGMVGVWDQADGNKNLLDTAVYKDCNRASPSTLPTSASNASESSTSNDMGLALFTSLHRFFAQVLCTF